MNMQSSNINCKRKQNNVLIAMKVLTNGSDILFDIRMLQCNVLYMANIHMAPERSETKSMDRLKQLFLLSW